MVSDGGTSKMGVRHHYYACKKKKKGACDKKRENKDALELYVTNCVRNFLDDKNNAKVVVEEVLNYYYKRTDEVNLKSIATKIAKANKEVEELADAFVKAKSALLQNTIETKMQEYEKLLDDLHYQQAQLELERGYKITKEDLLGFIEEILKGNPEDKDYQKKLIDNLVSQVFVSDDKTIVYFNISGGKSIETVDFENVKDSLSNNNGVQTQLPFARQ